MEIEEEDIIGRARVPGGGGELRLVQRGYTFTLWVNDTELMADDRHVSEDALGGLVAPLAARPEPIVLIGGLGMGFTLATALKTLGPGARVIVSELVAAVVAWNRGPLSHLAGHPLSDGRVTVRIEDVGASLRAARESFDAVLLDVDNGPVGLTRASNDWLYSNDGLAAGYEALRPGGVLCVWSSTPEKSFPDRLRKLGFEAEEIQVPVGDGEKNTIWRASKPAQ